MIYLVRHCESTKNRDVKFSSAQSMEGLTSDGEARAEQIFAALTRIMSERIQKADLFVSPSARCLDTALIGAEHLGLEAVCDSRLESIDPGDAAGMSENDVQSRWPNFFHDLKLYRAGLLCSYKIRAPNGAESTLHLEHRVSSFLVDRDVSLRHGAIIIASRSSISAILIYFCRQMLAYPEAYFGYTEIPFGRVFEIDTVNKSIDFFDVDLIKW